MAQIRPPTYDDLIEDLQVLRREGIATLRHHDYPALEQIALATGETDPNESIPPAALETVVRRAIQAIDGGRLADSAAILYGLDTGTRGQPPAELRRWAAQDWGVSVSRFRHRYEPDVIDQLAETMLRLAHTHTLRLAQLDLTRRTPVSSRLAINWLERFENYYRIWSTISGIAADLTACRQTLLDENRTYDRLPGTLTSDDPGGTHEEHALSYASDALVHYANHLADIEEFGRRYGGLWLLSDPQAEQEVADAVADVRLNTAGDEQDQAFLRRTWIQEAGRDHLAFRDLMRKDPTLDQLHRRWTNWVLDCRCQWDLADTEPPPERWPTHRHNQLIDPNCLVHRTVRACSDYCNLIDDDWGRIADWYRIEPDRKSRG